MHSSKEDKSLSHREYRQNTKTKIGDVAAGRDTDVSSSADTK